MTDNPFMMLVGIAIGGYMLVMILRAIFEKYGVSLSDDSSRSLKSILAWALKDREMRKRILITIGILLGLRIAFFLPLPGINFETLKELYRRIGSLQGGSVLLFFSEGAMARLSVFNVGLGPFFSSCLVVQLGSAFIPRLRQLSFGGERGREEVSKYSYIFTIIICLIESYFLSLWLENPAKFEGMRLVTAPGYGFRLTCMVTITAAVILLLYVSELISRYGIGNGIAVIAVSYIPVSFFAVYKQIMMLAKSSQLLFPPFLLGIIFIGFLYAAYFMTNRTRTIGFQDDNSNRIFIHFRPTIIGKAPLSFAQSIILFPTVLASIMGRGNIFYSFIKGHLLYYALYIMLVVFFTYFYTLIVFSPEYILQLARKFGYTLVKGNNGEEKDYLDNNMSKVLVLTALFFLVISLAPDLIMFIFRVPYLVGTFFGGIAIPYIVGVFSDIIHQLGFFKDKQDSGIKDWKICYIAFDEVEATIKSAYLKSKGISALVEPLRFSWGMPIRTAVDRYRIYVPFDRKEEARNLIIQ